MIPSIFTFIGVGLHELSAAGMSFLASILLSSAYVPGSVIRAGHEFIIPDSNTTTSPATYLADESVPIVTLPVNAPDGDGEVDCTGGTGSRLCTLRIKLTGSGGHRAHNAGSYTCGTATCSIVEARVFTEAIPRASERLYGGWTTNPAGASGAQLFNFSAASSGATIIGSGSYLLGGANGVNVEKDVPPGATIKFVWALGNGTEDYSNYKALAVIRFFEYYTP